MAKGEQRTAVALWQPHMILDKANDDSINMDSVNHVGHKDGEQIAMHAELQLALDCDSNGKSAMLLSLKCRLGFRASKFARHGKMKPNKSN